jgi:antitoxin (DNA-binding transcriptional repressor) of toxin-antitoxin stability system
MTRTISAKQLREQLPRIVQRVREGERFTVLYRSRPAFQLLPIGAGSSEGLPPLSEDPLFRAAALGSTSDGLTSGDHDQLLYGKRR